ncbi:hypothetical protein DM02DRAFT_655320 [Periconia macrospinosa]|uniref:Mid2 domain-containing protein n=1 Tax=Periconia macrospinosa TaxID=97972 RepID=A0A2V1DTL5_9PLEO|nr:hypothetical protein DM02DRAFT_655320 [Periconia macrospinosa]
MTTISTKSVPTRTLPLTTTFTPPADCWETPKRSGGPTQWFIAGGGFTTSCFPLAFPFSETSIVYSPGICPAGWTSACPETATIGSSTLEVAYCCPQSMGCVSTVSQSWESSFRCVRHMEIDKPWQDILQPGPYVSSLYQRAVMIVSADQTTSSSAMSTTPPIPSSIPSSIASSTASSAAAESSTVTPGDTAQGGNSLSKGVIAGMAIGAVVGTAIIILLSYVVWLIKKNRATQPPEYVSSPGYMHSSANNVYMARYQYPIELGAAEPAELHDANKSYAHEVAGESRQDA